MSTRDLIDAIESGNSSAIQQHFQDAIMSRVAERLDTMRIETAKSMFESIDSGPRGNIKTDNIRYGQVRSLAGYSDTRARDLAAARTPEKPVKRKTAPVKALPPHIDTMSDKLRDTLENNLGGSFEHFESDPRHHIITLPDGRNASAIDAVVTHSYNHKDLGLPADEMADTAETYPIRVIDHPDHGFVVQHRPWSMHESADEDYIHQVLADNDINSKVMGNTVHVDHDDVEKAQKLVKAHGYDHKVMGGLNETWRSVASDFGYDVEQVPNYMKYNHEVGQDVFTVHHTPEGSDYSKEIGRVNSLDQAKELVQRHATKHEPDLRLNEVLSKDATAGEWISDFVHSKDPKFAGKSKERRIKMALVAYYGAQRNESVELDEEAKIVHTRKGANGYTYNVKQNASNEYEIHSVDPKGKSSHIDTYQSLHRAKSVLDNEVKESVELDETSCGTKKKWGAIKDSMKDSVKK